MRILHSADWHLDAPMSGHSEEKSQLLRSQLRKIPELIVRLCQAERCDLLLLSGDLFDGAPSKECVATVKAALEKVKIPVVISPGNHDFCAGSSPYLTEDWPENVHIFTKPAVESFALPELGCRIYGAGYDSMDCPGLLKDFQTCGDEKWHIGVFHAEADTASSHYCPIPKTQIRDSGLHYLALGHIHKASSLRVGDTLCAWPGCPMGKGFDELGPKGVILVQLEDSVSAGFVPLDVPRFFDEEVEVSGDPTDAVAAILPAMETPDYYRITLTGYCEGVDCAQIQKAFPHVSNLTVLDETLPEMDLWSALGSDNLEGVYFSILHNATQSDSQTVARRAKLAAQLSRKILDGQEVKLP